MEECLFICGFVFVLQDTIFILGKKTCREKNVLVCSVNEQKKAVASWQCEPQRFPHRSRAPASGCRFESCRKVSSQD